VSAQPFEMSTIDSQTADHLNLVATRLRSGQFMLGGSALQFGLPPLAGPPRRISDPFQITLGWGGGELHLVATRSLLPLLYAHDFPQAPVDMVPQELALAALQLAVNELTAMLEQLSGRRVRLLRAGPADARSLLPAPFRFAASIDSAAARDGLEAMPATDALGLGLLALLARRQPPMATAREPDTPIALRIEVGAVALRVSALRALSLNDVLLLDGAFDPATPRVRLRIDQRHVLHAKLAEQSLIIESGVQEEPSMNTVADKAGPGEAVGLEEIEMRLCFDLGETTIKLGELGRVQTGQVLTLEAPHSQLVAIRANGRLIGRGELVRIADRVGVRVLKLGPAEPRNESSVTASTRSSP